MERVTVAGLRSSSTAAPGAKPVSRVEIAIVGAGLAGSVLALVLARRGHQVAIVDPHAPYPPDFRCEKLSAEQLALIEALGVADALAALPAPPGARRSPLERGFRYDELVNAMRGLWPSSVQFVHDRARGIVEGLERQRLELASGEAVEASLIVLAAGPCPHFREALGLRRHVVSERHSVCIGFSITPRGGGPLPFEGLVRHGARAGDRVGFASFFPVGDAMRVNLFLYHDPRSETVRRLRADPIGGLIELIPSLGKLLGRVELASPAEVRSTDLFRTRANLRPGLVTVGDAASSSCPATAIGVTRVLTDIRQLADTHLPAWLRSPGFGPEKIEQFDADPVRVNLDAVAHRRARTARRLATDITPAWRLRRRATNFRRWARSVSLKFPAHRPILGGISRSPLRRNQKVRVRSAAEILATLDGAGAFEGVPFMPEMAAFCGGELTVHRRAGVTCVEGQGIRRMTGAVLLDGARCDGAAHDGCQRNCLMFWKEAWLAPLDETAAPVDLQAEAAAAQALSRLPTMSGGLYHCQSTALGAATTATARGDVVQMVRDVWLGEVSPTALLSFLVRGIINRIRRLAGMPDLGVLSGVARKPARGGLNLEPGDWVRIKPRPALRRFLTPDSRNFGLSFEPEMAKYAGAVRQVDFPVQRIIHEETGRMIHLKNTVGLKGVTCQGRCARNCARANTLYWRESWLERVDPEVAS
jgi:2-polyprenyl-6-methoxyphenol hydroxylase-like FAD-dependent oxidoreductase